MVQYRILEKHFFPMFYKQIGVFTLNITGYVGKTIISYPIT